MTKYLRIPADGEKPMEIVDLTGLEQLREGIGGGWLEGVNLPPGRKCPGARFYCDEEFQFKPELQVNLRASLMAQAAGVLPTDDSIIGGDVLLFDLDPNRGENDMPVSERTILWAQAVEALLKDLGALT